MTGHLKIAKNALSQLLEMGFSQKQIAAEVAVCDSQISRIKNDEDWPVSEALAKELESFVVRARESFLARARKMRVADTLCLKLKIVDTCNAAGTSITSEVRGKLTRGLIQSLVEFLSTGAPVTLPRDTKVTGVLVQLSDNVHLFVRDRDAGSKVLAHELEHMARRLRADARSRNGDDDHEPQSLF